MRIKQTIVNLDEIQSIHFDDDNATISVVFNATNTLLKFNFFDENNATKEDWSKYSETVQRVCNKAKTFISTKNPFV